MKCARRRLMIAIISLIFIFPLAASSQWDKKPSDEWTEKEATKILTDSPWGQTQTFTDVVQGTTDVSRDAPLGQSRVPDEVRVNFRVRFLTGLAVRLAFARLLALKQKEEMSAQMAEQLKKFTAPAESENVVVAVMVDSTKASNRFAEARATLMRVTTNELKNDTYLVVKGQRVFLKEYIPPGSEGFGARFVFPRLVDGKPFITPETSEVRFYADLPRGFQLNQKFKIKDMMFEGKLEY